MFHSHRVLGLVASTAILVFGTSTPVFSDDKTAEKVIVAFGDSTTAPRDSLVVYATLLEKELASQAVRVQVINAGVPSNATTDALARFEKDVVARKPNVVILQFGINDAAVNVWQEPPASAPRVSPEDYEKNLLTLVRALKSHGVKVVLMTPNPCRWTNMLKKLYGKPPYHPDDPDGFNVLLQGYAATVRRVAKQEGVSLVDVYEAFQAYGKEPGQSVDDLLLDGMHPNAKGHELVAKLLLASKPLGKKAN